MKWVYEHLGQAGTHALPGMASFDQNSIMKAFGQGGRAVNQGDIFALNYGGGLLGGQLYMHPDTDFQFNTPLNGDKKPIGDNFSNNKKVYKDPISGNNENNSH